MAVIDLTELTPFGSGKSAILRDFGVLRRKFPEPMAVSSEVRDGRAWFGGRIPLPPNPNLGTISTMPPEGYKPSYFSGRESRGRAQVDLAMAPSHPPCTILGRQTDGCTRCHLTVHRRGAGKV